MTAVMGRRRARRLILRVLFQQDFRCAQTPLEELLGGGVPDPYVEEVLRGVQRRRAELDALIGERARGWKLERLVSVDRNILRLAIYELLYTDTPPEVVINEAVELAKRYGTERSPAFINGILDRLWKERQEKGQEEAKDAPCA